MQVSAAERPFAAGSRAGVRPRPIWTLLLAPPVFCIPNPAMPPEVTAFIEERNACEHFMGDLTTTRLGARLAATAVRSRPRLRR